MPEAQLNGGERVPQSAKELEAFLEAYKKKNPVKYARKEANHEFDKLRSKFGLPSTEAATAEVAVDEAPSADGEEKSKRKYVRQPKAENEV